MKLAEVMKNTLIQCTGQGIGLIPRDLYRQICHAQIATRPKRLTQTSRAKDTTLCSETMETINLQQSDSFPR